MKKWLLIVTAAAVAAALFAGCGRRGGTVLAEINGEKITGDDFVKYVSGMDMATKVLKQMLDDRLVLAMAKEKGVAPTDEQVNQRLSLLRKTQDLDAQLKESGRTLDDLKEQFRVQQAYINLAEQAMKDKITDEDVKSAYEARKPLLYDVGDGVRTDYIRFTTEDAAKKAAKEIQGGATLEKVAEDAGVDHGPILHEVIRKTVPGLPPELVKAVFEVPKGKVSPPIKIVLPFGEQWLIVRPGDRLPPVKVSFDEAKAVIRGELAVQKASLDSDYQKKMDEARRKAKITIFQPSLKRAEKEFRSPSPPPPGPMPRGPR